MFGQKGAFWPTMRPLSQGARVGRRAGSVSLDMTSLLSTNPATSSALPTGHRNIAHVFSPDKSYRADSGRMPVRQCTRSILGERPFGKPSAAPKATGQTGRKAVCDAAAHRCPACPPPEFGTCHHEKTRCDWPRGCFRATSDPGWSKPDKAQKNIIFAEFCHW